MIASAVCLAMMLGAGVAHAAVTCELKGAKADGTTKDTVALQAAIDACTAKGGGEVSLKAGTYLSGPLDLLEWLESSGRL